MKDKPLFETVNSLLFNLAKLKEVTNTLLVGNEEWLSKNEFVYEDHKEKIVKSFKTNIEHLIKRIDMGLLPNKLEIKRIRIESKETQRLFNNAIYNLDENTLFLLAKCNAAINVFLSSCVAVKEDNVENSKVPVFANTLKTTYFFRGQSDYRFDLLASMFREISDKEETINFDYIVKKYNELWLLEKYKNIFNEKNIHVNQFAYMQHSFSYSPLLDVTFSKEIATIFATTCYRINPNHYFKTDAALYLFVLKERSEVRETIIMRNINIKYIPHKISFNEKFGTKGYLFENDYRIFDANYKLFTKQYNDRMKYQRGAFLLFVKGYIINGKMMIPYDQLTVIKYRIKAVDKKNIYLSIVEKNRQYQISNIYNPYDYFADYNFK